MNAADFSSDARLCRRAAALLPASVTALVAAAGFAAQPAKAAIPPVRVYSTVQYTPHGYIWRRFHVRSASPAPAGFVRGGHGRERRSAPQAAADLTLLGASQAALAVSAAGAAPPSPVSAPSAATPAPKSVYQHALHARAAAAYSYHPAPDVTLDFVGADINDVLKALAVQTGMNVVSSSDVKGAITVSLAHVTLEQALDMISRLSGYEYAKTNNTYIVGTPSDLDQFASSSANASQTTAVLPLHYAAATDVTTLLKSRYPSMDISTGASSASRSVGAKAAVVVSGQQNMVEAARELVASLEQSLADRVTEQTTETYAVRYTSLGDLIGILNTLVPSLQVTPGPSVGFSASAPSAAATAASSSSSTSGATPAGSSSGGSAGGASGSGGSPSASGSGSSGMTGPSVLLLTGTPEDIARAREVLAKVDVRPVQLLFDTKVTEINDSEQKNIGLNWTFANAATHIGEVVPSGYSPTATINPSNYPGQILKFGTFARSPIYDLADVSLDALVADDKAKLLADPNIAALDGYPAQVFIGDTINYVQSITTSTTGENVLTASVQVGVILRVTGKVNNDGYITLNIHPEVSTINGYLATPGGGSLPNVATRYADTTIRVKDGETIAIGGLIQDNDIVTINKVPGLGDLPFFGALFRDTQHQRTRNEVVFFLKTSIQKDS